MLADSFQQVVDQGSITPGHQVPEVATNQLRGNQATVNRGDAHG